MGRATKWRPVVLLGALLSGACGDDFVGATDTDSGSGGSTGDSTGGTLPTTTNPPTTDTTTEPPPTTSNSSTIDPTGTEPTTDTPTTDTTSPGTLTTIDTDTMGTTDTTSATDTTDTDSTTGTNTDTDTDTGNGAVGQSVSQTVNGGTKASSANFSMVFTVGQPTQNQGTYKSANFRLQGGLIGANGDPP